MWISWVQEVWGANCRESIREVLLAERHDALREALDARSSPRRDRLDSDPLAQYNQRVEKDWPRC
jgi:hypothetical protein